MEEREVLTHKNFRLYAARHYDNPHCIDDEEFFEDLNRIKYIKKLLTRYEQTGVLRERLILNHLIIMNNLFGPIHTPRIVYLKMAEQFHLIKPFLILLKILPEKLYNIEGIPVINTDEIPLDQGVVELLRQI